MKLFYLERNLPGEYFFISKQITATVPFARQVIHAFLREHPKKQPGATR